MCEALGSIPRIVKRNKIKQINKTITPHHHYISPITL
jgi:hypothetical protein